MTWEHAAPGGTAPSMLIESRSLWTPTNAHGLLHVAPHGTFTAASPSSLELCSGRLSVAQLDDLATVLHETHAFDRSGRQHESSCTHSTLVRVSLSSADRGETSFYFNWCAVGGEPANRGLRDLLRAAEGVWQSIADDECRPNRLDPGRTAVEARFATPEDLLRGHMQTLRVGAGGELELTREELPGHEPPERLSCAERLPAEAHARVLGALIAAAPGIGHGRLPLSSSPGPRFGFLSVSADTAVAAPSGERVARATRFYVDDEEPGHAQLSRALAGTLEGHCP